MAARKPDHALSQTATAVDTRRWYWANHDRAKALKRDAMRRARAVKPEHARKIGKRARDKRRNQLLEMYGRLCARCGFDDPRALTLDHILRNGSEERRQFGERGVYAKAVAEHRPDLYRTLCMNCQFIVRSEIPQVAAAAFRELMARMTQP